MVSWGKAIVSSLICVAWCFLWLFIGGSMVIYGIYLIRYGSNYYLQVTILIIVGLVIIGLPFNTAFFKFFPETINKGEITWGEAFRGSASYFGSAVYWGAMCFTLSPGTIAGAIGIRGSYYQTLASIITGDEIEGKSAWNASGHMFGWVLLWVLVGGIIILFGFVFLNQYILEYYYELVILVLTIVTALYLMIMGISAAEFKEFSDIIIYGEIRWEDSYRAAVKYAAWCILWLFIGGFLIYLGFFTRLYPPRNLPPMPRVISNIFYYVIYYINPIIISAIGVFILAWGCLSAYIKYFGDILEVIT
ncbi:MAG: hypothetical protein ACFFDN_48140 [Candidatus Hodarchaeota archaeon]